jgi:adenosylhomocysteine nucleosidase
VSKSVSIGSFPAKQRGFRERGFERARLEGAPLYWLKLNSGFSRRAHSFTGMNSSASGIAIVAALGRELRGLAKISRRVEREYEGRKFIFFEHGERVAVCGGIGVEPARRAAEAVIALYHPAQLVSVGFAGALLPDLRVGDIISPATVIDARDGSHIMIEGGVGTLITFMAVASPKQKVKLAQAYGAQAVDMEAAAVAAAARAHGIRFTATKVISDGLDFEMPETARFIDAHGRFRAASFAVYAAVRPWLWLRLAQLASNSNKAARILGDHLTRSQQPLNEAFEAKTTEISSKR